MATNTSARKLQGDLPEHVLREAKVPDLPASQFVGQFVRQGTSNEAEFDRKVKGKVLQLDNPATTSAAAAKPRSRARKVRNDGQGESASLMVVVLHELLN